MLKPFDLLKNFRWALVVISALLVSCSGNQTGNLLKNAGTTIVGSQKAPDTTLQLEWGNAKRKVYLMPANTFFARGNILLLHGWNLSPTGWCEQTTLCEKLRNAGYNIIVPDMGKSMYASEIYPETMKSLADQPQLNWLTDTVLVYLRDSFNLLSPGMKNFVVGLSTGARGAFAVALTCPDVFSGAVVLSGDYDQTLMPDDNLMTYYYGNYDMYPERWEGKDNLLRRADEWKIPIYIGHAVEDPVVPFEQSDTLYKTLIKLGKVEPVANFPFDYGHDYRYWESETNNILKFISDISNTEVVSSGK